MAGVKQAPKLQLTQVHQLVGFGPRPKNNGYSKLSKLWVTIENLRGFKMIEVGFYFCNNMVIIGYPGFGDPTLNHGWDVMCG